MSQCTVNCSMTRKWNPSGASLGIRDRCSITTQSFSSFIFWGPGCSESVLCSIYYHRNCPSTINNSKGTLVHRAIPTSGARTQTTSHQSVGSRHPVATTSDHLSDIGVCRCPRVIQGCICRAISFHSFHSFWCLWCLFCHPTCTRNSFEGQ